MRRIVGGHAAVSDLDLSSMLHAGGTPWKDVAEENGFSVKAGTVVPAWRIERHFRVRLADNGTTADLLP